MLKTLESGLKISVNRIDRREIDKFATVNPKPEPPTRTVTVWGGLEEQVPIYDDPEYVAAVNAYYMRIGRDQYPLICRGLSLVEKMRDGPDPILSELFPNYTPEQLIIYENATSNEIADLTGRVFYLSTVTDQGIGEAEALFNARWDGKPVSAYKLPGDPVKVAQVYRDRVAATAAGYKWAEFCDLPGPEQSEIVAFYLIQNYLTWLQQQNRK